MMPATEKSKLFSIRLLAYDFLRVTAALPGLVWLRPRYIYASKKARERVRGGALIVANHVSFLDPVYVQFAVWYRRQRIICAKEFFDGRFRAFLFRLFRAIPVDRENFGMESFRGITDVLHGGEVVTIFPEGHINDREKSVAAFKSGAVLMSMRSGAPVVPVYIRRPAHVWNRLTAVIGEPVDVPGLCGKRPTFARIGEVSELLWEKECELMRLSGAMEENE